MAFMFRTRRSAGIRVTAAVYRLIVRGNAARDRGSWYEAHVAYGAALEKAPDLYHIHVQRGHALKQAGMLDKADAAYAEAMRLRPSDGEALLHRVQLADSHVEGRHVVVRWLLAAVVRQPGLAGLETAVSALLAPIATVPTPVLRRVLEQDGAVERLVAAADAPMRHGSFPRVFDITDLVGHFRHQRLPNGIERVQIEILIEALGARGDDGIGICCFLGARDGWVGMPPGLFRDVARLATTDGDTADPVWQETRARLFLHLALAPGYDLPEGAVLLNLGTSWWVHDYFRHIRNAKMRRNIRYIPLIYDLIPILRRKYCKQDITRDFSGWLIGALRHADGFIAISRHSRNDLMHVAGRIARPVPAAHMEVVPLDADFRRPVRSMPSTTLAAWRLTPGSFVLLVSTIEPRKNHALAFDAWSALLRRYGPDKVPRLVCVGRDGWLNDAVLARLDLDPLLAGHVTLVPQVSDNELALLYGSCCFTLYPSLYEGWGLPVTEALCHGRVAVVADNSSLPEAGGRFAVLFASGSLAALVAAVEQVAFDDGWRQEREAMIAAHFMPRSWARIAEQFDGAVTRLLATPLSPNAMIPLVRQGLYYPAILHRDICLSSGMVGGEDIRIGDGWLWPEPDGCRTAPGGGEVRLRAAGPAGRLRLHCRVRGLATVDCPVSVVIDGQVRAQMVIAAGKTRWLACDITSPDLSFVLRGDMAEMVEMPNGPRSGSITLLGLLVAHEDMQRDVLLAEMDRAGLR